MLRPTARPALNPLAATILSALMMGCPDPSPVGSYQEYGAAGPSASAGGAAGDAAGPTDQGATQPNAARFQCGKEDACVKVTGSFNYTGTQSGMNRVDFQSVVENSPPRLAHTLELKKTGPWTINAPKDFGALRIVAFIDLGGDGPSKGDPGAVVEVEVGAEDLTNVSLDLSDDFDVTVLSPGSGPGAGSPDMAAGGAPPDGDPGAASGDPQTQEGANINQGGPSGPAPGQPGGPPTLPDAGSPPAGG
ncbi:MAG: hypothetical protein VX000_06035 [Myxococcota bacterium]|nr:hypothetical protein [Myxococcota bacterium]